MRCILAITAFLMVVCSANVMATGFVEIDEKPTCHPLGKIEAGMVYERQIGTFLFCHKKS